MSEGEKHSPLEQFEIISLYDINLGNFSLNFTNSALLMVLSVVISVAFLLLATKDKLIIPNKTQMFAEFLYSFVKDMLVNNTGKEGLKFFPLAFSLFIFVLFCNLLGMIPYSYTSTSHIIITFALATSLFIVIVIAAFRKHGLKFLSIFMPTGTPLWLAPLLIFIELFAYLARPISLSIRLAANMTAGHTMMKVIAGFVISMGYIGGWLPLLFLVLLTGFEIFVAILQAYIFTMLACVYLNDAVHLDH